MTLSTGSAGSLLESEGADRILTSDGGSGGEGMRAEVIRVCPRCADETTERHCPRCQVPVVWECVVDLDAPLADGRTRIRRSHNRRAEAEITLRRLVDEYDNSLPLRRPAITVGEYLDEVWLPTVRKTVDDSAWRSYHDEVHRHVISRIGDETLGSIWCVWAIERLFKKTLPSEGRLDGEGGLSPRTVRYIWSILHRALDDGVAWKFLDANPARGAHPGRDEKPRRRRRPGMWTTAQVERFMDLAGADRLATAWTLIATTGLRRSEVLGLRWSDVDLDAASFTVAQVYVTVNGRCHFTPPRSRHALRTVDLDPESVAALTTWRDRQGLERGEVGEAWDEHGLVFTQTNGRPVDPDNFTKAFARLVSRARLPHVSLEDLRLMHAVALFDAGTDPDEVARRLGHHSGYYTRRACLAYLAEAHLPADPPATQPSNEGMDA